MAFRLLARAGKYSLLGAGAVAPVMAYEAYTYRPRGSQDTDFHERMRGVDRAPTNPVDKFFYDLTMTWTLGFCSTVFHTIMHHVHRTEILNHEGLLRLIMHE